MSAQLQATGVVLSTDPVVTITADLVHHDLVLTYRTAYGQTQCIAIGGQKLLDLIRFAQLALGPQTWSIQCWRCDRYFEHTAKSNSDGCPVCLHAAHCADCDEWLHPSNARAEPR